MLKSERMKKKILEGIESVVFDLDDTLISTRKVFREAITESSKFLLKSPMCSKGKRKVDEVAEMMLEIIKAIREEFFVRPAIMEMATLLTAQLLGLDKKDKCVEKGLERIRRIYNRDVPEIFEGAGETVDVFNGIGIRTFLMTHGQEDYTWRKIIGAGLIGKFEKIVCFSVDRKKEDQWENEFDKLGLKTENILVIGDNPKADIEATIRLGARAVWVSSGLERERSKVEELWKKRVIEIEKIGDLFK